MAKKRDLIEPLDFSKKELEELFKLSEKIIKDEKKFAKCCETKLLATLFYEPSTRTRFSFEAAMLRLGGKVIGFSGSENSSAAKGESIRDTIKTVSCYADIAVIRHHKEGSALVAKNASDMPIINGGDGGHQHPTQTLTDLLTIYREKKRFDNIKIGLCGDLKFGRTVHSLIKALSRYENITFYLISPEELVLPDYVMRYIKESKSCKYIEERDLNSGIKNLDILYMTRVQRERFFNEDDYLRLKDFYILDEKKMRFAREDMIVLHPLPRVNEIDPKVDDDKRAKYFDQAKNGMYVRMALIITLLGIKVK